MPSYWRVSPRFWTDPDMRRASDDARTLALYLLTCEHRNVIGLFRLPRAYIADDLQWLPERLGKPFGELLEMGFLAYDGDAQVMLICNAMKYQAPENDNQVTAALRQLEDLPDTFLTSDFKPLAQRFCKRLAERLPEGLGEGFAQPTATATATATDLRVAESATARDLVAAYVDAYRGRAGHDPPSRVKGQLAKELAQLLRDGVPIETVKAGMGEWFERDQHPSVLASIVESHARGGRTRATTRQERGRAQLIETDQALDQWATSKQEGGGHGRARMADAGQAPQRELPRPGAPT